MDQLKGDFSTNFVLQQKTAIDEKKVIRGKLSSALLQYTPIPKDVRFGTQNLKVPRIL